MCLLFAPAAPSAAQLSVRQDTLLRKDTLQYTLGVMDKTYLSVPPGILTQIRESLQGLSLNSRYRDVLEAYSRNRSLPGDLRRYKELTSLGAQAQVSDSKPVYAVSLLYSNSVYGFDIDYRHFTGEFEGDGVRLLIDPKPFRVRDLEGFYQQYFEAPMERLEKVRGRQEAFENTPLSGLPALFVEGEKERSEVAAAVETLRAFFDRLPAVLPESYDPAGEYLKAVYAPRVVLVSGYTDTTVGTFWNAGMRASVLRPIRLSERPEDRLGLLSLASVEYSEEKGAGQRYRSAVRFGLTFALQDRAPYGSAGEYLERSRWRWQGGVEAHFKSRLDPDHSGGVFVRYRPNHSVEYGLLAGVGSDHRGYVGARVEVGF
jgi:hypothetical protein